MAAAAALTGMLSAVISWGKLINAVGPTEAQERIQYLMPCALTTSKLSAAENINIQCTASTTHTDNIVSDLKYY